MANTQKPAARKTSAGTQPQGTAATTNASKSAKENTDVRSTSAAKKTSGNSNVLPKPSAKPVKNSLPLQTKSSHGAKDTDTVALLARIAVQQGSSIYF